jgi:hypothetical protein
MNTNLAKAFGIVLLASQIAFADASYESTSQVSGGSLMEMLKSNPIAAKAARQMYAPTNTLTMVHGNRKATVNKDSTQIVDLDAETVTHIDTAKKTYSVMTFEQMRQAVARMTQGMERAQARAQQQKTDVQTSFEVSVKNTGVTKVINGLTAQEQIVTMQMHVTDPNAPPSAGGNTSTFVVTTDAWIAPDPPEVQEVHDFDKRMGEKMAEGVDMSAFAGNNSGSAQLMGSRPGMAEAMIQMGKEMAKVKGTRVREVTTIGGTGQAAPSGATSPPAGTSGSSGGSVAGQVANDTATQTAEGESSRLGIPGSALAGSVLGAFHRKKAAPTPTPTPVPTPTPAPAATEATDGAGTPAAPGAILMETTKEVTNFSQEAIPVSVFQVPSGFKQVPSPLERMGR